MAPEQHRRILLYGDSLILGSVGAALGKHPRFEVLPLSPPLPGPAELEAMAPDAVLFDAETGRPDAAFSLLETRPDLILLGISPDGNVVRRWSGQQYQALSARDLSEIIGRGSATGAASGPDRGSNGHRGPAPRAVEGGDQSH